MKRLIALALLAGFGAAAAGQPAHHPLDPEKVRTVEGKITRVQAEPGQGMPFLMVESEGAAVKVVLGSMRYLLSKDFNPKAGEKVRVVGFETGETELVARSVELIDSGKTLKLRDEQGRPLWQRGHHGRHGRHHHSEPPEEKP